MALRCTSLVPPADTIASAEAAGLGHHPAVVELRELAGRKEKSIE